MSDGMSLRSGVHRPLEEAANEFLRGHLAGITKHSDKSDILTPWKEADRRRHEVYVSTGVPDATLRRGTFHRVSNIAAPHLNSVEGMTPPKFDRARGSNSWDHE